jgi:DNA-binding NarL/FixJ family response regulator
MGVVRSVVPQCRDADMPANVYGLAPAVAGDRQAMEISRVRVLIVDDATDIRRLLRLLFEKDDRFEVIGEGEDGVEAIELADALQPNLILLDRQMPRLGGVEAIPELKRVAPRAAVILFTAKADAGAYHAAISAGALDVVEKSTVDVVDRLARTLLDHWSDPDAELQVQIGPVPTAATAAWIDNTRRILVALRAHPDVLSPPPPAAMLDLFERFLDIWDEINRGADEFFWSARAASSVVLELVEWWARIDGMSDDQLVELGVHWSSPEGRTFFHALAAAVLGALEQHAATQELAETLRRQWAADL